MVLNTGGDMLERIKKHYALKSYVKKLGPLLRKRYGKSKSYSPGQVKTTIQINGLNEYNISYAYALFCKQSAFNQETSGSEGKMDYKAVRQELGNKFFDREDSFSTSDVIKMGHEMSGRSDIGIGRSTFPINNLDN